MPALESSVARPAKRGHASAGEPESALRSCQEFVTFPLTRTVDRIDAALRLPAVWQSMP
jgi:hypothetical protein